MHINTITLKVASREPIPANTSVAHFAYMATTHAWPIVSLEVRSRPATREESAKAEAAECPLTPEQAEDLGSGECRLPNADCEVRA